MRNGQTIKDFVVTKSLPLDELQATLVELVHVPSGARVMHVANDDPENLFSLSLQTIPSSSNGVAHILEHVVLCGSKKFPVKDPFFAMTRRSLHTFMNAMTGQDFTCYPAGSQVEKDFYNLLEVYLDAVFHPLLKKESFWQDGHRLELVGDHLRIHGVVYNEMKGAMGSPDARLWEAISKHLTPDLPYAHNSGGNPHEIPNLSYEELVQFHRTFYHPSRCLFFFYGSLPLQKHLDFIESHVLARAEKLPPLPPLPMQPRFASSIRAVDYYPIHASESPQGKTKIAFCWLTVPISHQSEVLALCLMECILLETDASPLKKALLKSGLCKEVGSSLDIEMSEVPLSIICNGCDEANEEKLQALLFATLEKICARPIDPELIEAALHQLEFERTEISTEGTPFGLTLFMRAALIKQHGSEPESALLIHQLFAELRKQLKDTNFLPRLIRKTLIENTHFLTQLLIGDPHLEEAERKREETWLEKIRVNKEQLVEQAKRLAQYHEADAGQSFECLPKISLHDIPKQPRDFPLTHISLPNIEVYHHECFTNQIIYADLLFDLPRIEADELSLLSLATQLWTELGVAGKSYEEALHAMQAHTGGIDAHLALNVSSKDPDALKPSFSLRGKALLRNAKELFQLLTDYASTPDFTDRPRIREWLLQHLSELEEDLLQRAIQYAIQLSLSGNSVASWVYNQWNGLPYYQFVKQLSEDSNDAWMERLPALAKRLISTGKPHLVLSCGSEEVKHLHSLANWHCTSDAPAWQSDYPLVAPPSQARPIPAPVAFTALGMRAATYRDPGVAELMLSTQLIENVVLHKAVREKGGAYGTGATYAPTTGNFHLYAYRDPHLSATVSAFHAAIDAISRGKFSDRDLEEAKIGLLGAMDTPVAPGKRGLVAYNWLRSDRSLSERQALREQILAATKKGVESVVQERLRNAPSTLVSFLGTDLYKKEADKLPIPFPLKIRD